MAFDKLAASENAQQPLYDINYNKNYLIIYKRKTYKY